MYVCERLSSLHLKDKQKETKPGSMACLHSQYLGFSSMIFPESLYQTSFIAALEGCQSGGDVQALQLTCEHCTLHECPVG